MTTWCERGGVQVVLLPPRIPRQCGCGWILDAVCLQVFPSQGHSNRRKNCLPQNQPSCAKLTWRLANLEDKSSKSSRRKLLLFKAGLPQGCSAHHLFAPLRKTRTSAFRDNRHDVDSPSVDSPLTTDGLSSPQMPAPRAQL